MELPTQLEQRKKYLDQIQRFIPQGARDLDSLIIILSEIDHKNHPKSSEEDSERFARNVLFGIRRVFEKSEKYSELLVKTRITLDERPVPVTYITKSGIELLADYQTPRELYGELQTDLITQEKADIKPGLYNSLHHYLKDSLNNLPKNK